MNNLSSWDSLRFLITRTRILNCNHTSTLQSLRQWKTLWTLFPTRHASYRWSAKSSAKTWRWWKISSMKNSIQHSKTFSKLSMMLTIPSNRRQESLDFKSEIFWATVKSKQSHLLRISKISTLRNALLKQFRFMPNKLNRNKWNSNPTSLGFKTESQWWTPMKTDCSKCSLTYWAMPSNAQDTSKIFRLFVSWFLERAEETSCSSEIKLVTSLNSMKLRTRRREHLNQTCSNQTKEAEINW